MIYYLLKIDSHTRLGEGVLSAMSINSLIHNRL